MRCPDENVLAEYVDHVLGDGPRRDVDAHLDRCVGCRAIVSDLARMQHASGEQTIAAALDADTSVTTHADVATLDIAYHRQRTAQIVPGTMIGDYEVTHVLGAGGMGIVFAAIHPRIGKKAAIKILKRTLATENSSIVRFENEARAVNAIGHPNIVDIFGFGELPNGDPYYVMEHVDGKSLHEWICVHAPISLERAMPILRPICDALSAAHERGIIHRDLKPANIMVAGSDEAPRVKVLDFGLAKMAPADRHYDDELTSPGVAIGTPAFMSPEQFMAQDVDQRTDVYALGVIVYQMLCGCYPFQGATPSEIGQQHLYHTPTRPSKLAPLPEKVDRILHKALAKKAVDRFGSVRELCDELEKSVRETPSMPRPATMLASPAAAPDAVTMMPAAVQPAVVARPVAMPAAVQPPTVVVARPVAPVAPVPPPPRRMPRWLVAGGALSVIAVAIVLIVSSRSTTSTPAARAMPAPAPAAAAAAPEPAPAPAPPPIVEDATPPAPAVVEEPKQETEPAPAPAIARKPVKRSVKKPTAPRTKTKPATEDDDKMLLERGTVKKQ